MKVGVFLLLKPFASVEEQLKIAKDMGFIRFQKEYRYAEAIYWLTSVIFEKDMDIASLQKRLSKNRVPTRRIFMPVVEFPPYRKYRRAESKNSYRIYEKGLSLPSSTLNSENDIRYICKVLKKCIHK